MTMLLRLLTMSLLCVQYGITPLHVVCAEGFVKVLKVLLSDSRVNVNKVAEVGRVISM